MRRPVTFSPTAANVTGRYEILKSDGPTIDAIICREPGAETEQGVRDEFETKALIDTGASHCCIDYRLAHALKLRVVNQTNVNVVGSSILVEVYLGVCTYPL